MREAWTTGQREARAQNTPDNHVAHDTLTQSTRPPSRSREALLPKEKIDPMVAIQPSCRGTSLLCSGSKPNRTALMAPRTCISALYVSRLGASSNTTGRASAVAKHRSTACLKGQQQHKRHIQGLSQRVHCCRCCFARLLFSWLWLLTGSGDGATYLTYQCDISV